MDQFRAQTPAPKLLQTSALRMHEVTELEVYKLSESGAGDHGDPPHHPQVHLQPKWTWTEGRDVQGLLGGTGRGGQK